VVEVYAQLGALLVDF